MTEAEDREADISMLNEPLTTKGNPNAAKADWPTEETNNDINDHQLPFMLMLKVTNRI